MYFWNHKKMKVSDSSCDALRRRGTQGNATKFHSILPIFINFWMLKQRISPQTSEADQFFSWGGRLLEGIILGIVSAKNLRLQGSVNCLKVPLAWTSSLRIPRMLNLVQVLSYSLFTYTIHYCSETILATTLQEHVISPDVRQYSRQESIMGIIRKYEQASASK